MSIPSLREGIVPISSKGTAVCPLLNRSSSDPMLLNNYHPIFNLPFSVKVVENVRLQLLRSLEKAEYLVQFQSAFSTEIALVALADDLLHSLDGGDTLILVLLGVLLVFYTVNHNILLDKLWDLRIGKIIFW